MTLNDWEFILANTEDNGASIVRACVRTSDDRWRKLFDAGYPEQSFRTLATRRQFASSLSLAKEPVFLEAMVRAYLERLPVKQRVELFELQLETAGKTLWQSAMSQAATNPAQRKLVELAREYGADFNAPVKFVRRKGERRETSGLALAIADREIDTMRMWLQFGADYAADEAAQQQMANLFRYQHWAVVPALKLLIETFNAPLDLFMPLTMQDQASTNGCAYLHAIAARRSMDLALAQATPGLAVDTPA